MQDVDLTKGKLSKALLNFSLPVVLLDFFCMLFGLIDIFMIGQFTEGGTGVAAVSVGASLLYTFGSVLGIVMGGTIMVGNAYGAKQRSELGKIVGTMMVMFPVMGVVIGILVFIFAPLLLGVMNTPAEIAGDTTTFIRICRLSFVCLAIMAVVNATLRGVGNTLAPLQYMGCSVGINIILDFIFLYFFKWGVAGVAIGSVIAEGLGMVVAIWCLRRQTFVFKFGFKDLCFYKDIAKKVLSLGVPISSTYILLNISFVCVVSIVNGMGVASAAAFAIGQKLSGFTTLPANSLAGSLAALTAQHVGAHFIYRAKQALFLAIMYAYVFCSFFFCIQMLFPEWVISIFTDDIAVIYAGKDFLLSSSWILLIIAPYLCLCEFFNGCGKTKFTMCSSIGCSFLIYVPLAFLFTMPENATLYDLRWAAVISNAIELFIFIVAFKTKFWHRDKAKVLDYKRRKQNMVLTMSETSAI